MKRGEFLTKLRVEHQDRRQRKLLAPLVYRDPVHGDITAPEDFVTDFASTRAVRTVAVVAYCIHLALRLLPVWEWVHYAAAAIGFLALVFYAVIAGYCDKAGTIHDWLYKTGLLTRRQADMVLVRAAFAEGIAKWRAFIFWVGVRVGGKSHYKTED